LIVKEVFIQLVCAPDVGEAVVPAPPVDLELGRGIGVPAPLVVGVVLHDVHGVLRWVVLLG